MTEDITTPDLGEVMNGRVHESDVRRNNLMRHFSKRLESTLAKKIETSFIGALSKFESYFGVIWGHGKTLNDCTESQRQMRGVWNRCRTELLNNGNSQIRAIKSELGQHDVFWNGHRTELVVPNRDTQASVE